MDDTSSSCNSTSLCTERHIHHNRFWTVNGFTLPTFCIACATERLENRQNELTVKISLILDEFSTQTGKNGADSPLLKVIASDWKIIDHITTVLINLLSDEDSTILQHALQSLINITQCIPKDDIVMMIATKSIKLVMSNNCYTCSTMLGHLTLIGQLSHNSSLLVKNITQIDGKFIDYLINGLSCMEKEGGESVKSLIVYILVQLCSVSKGSSLHISWIQRICSHLSVSLATARSHDLTLNLMGLVKNLLHIPSYAQYLFDADTSLQLQGNNNNKGSTFASAFKRVLLSQDEILQLSGVQCVSFILSEYPQYIDTLMGADIAEYLFEALNVDNPKLVSTIFNCLVIMTDTDEFYSGCHVVYGFQPILKALKNAVLTRNYDGIKAGLSLLSSILQRQPPNIPLLTAEQSINDIMSIINSCLQQKNQSENTSTSTTVVATETLKNLMRVQYISNEVSLQIFLPHLSVLLLHADTLFSQSLQTNDKEKKREEEEFMKQQLFVEILDAFSNLCKLFYDRLPSEGSGNDEIHQFILHSTQETLIPISLVILIDVSNVMCRRCLSFLCSILTCLLQINKSSHELALSLVRSGFIELIMEYRSVSDSINTSSMVQFTEQLSYNLINIHEAFTTNESTELKTLLHCGLPDIKCNLNDSLKFLIQKGGVAFSGESHSHTRSVQVSVLCLLYLTEEYVGISDKQPLLIMLSQFISLHNDFHLFPTPSIKQLLMLYTVSKLTVGHSSSVIEDILVKGILRHSSPSSLFTGHVSLIVWAYDQAMLRNSLTKEWLQQWLLFSVHDYNQLINNLIDWSPLKDDLMSLLVSGKRECLSQVTELLSLLITRHQSEELQDCILRSLEVFFLTQRFDSVCHQSTALKLLCHIPYKDNIKLFCQVVNIVSNTSNIQEGSTVLLSMEYGIQFIYKILSIKGHQAICMVANDESLIAKVIQILHSPVTNCQYSPSLLSVSALFITKLIEESSYFKGEKKELTSSMLLQLLLHEVISVKLAAVNLWKSLLSKNNIFKLVHDGEHKEKELQTYRTLGFILLNLMTEDKADDTFLTATVDCCQVLLQYSKKHFENQEIITKDWFHILNSFLTMRYADTDLPLPFKQLIKEHL